MPKYTTVFLLFLLPFLVLPFGISFFETPKIILGQIGIWLLFLSLFFQKGRLSLRNFDKIQLVIVFLIFVTTLLQLVVLKNALLFGNVFRLQGVFLLWHLLLFSLLSSRVDLEGISNKIYFFFLIGLSLVTLFLGGNLTGRAIGTLGEPNVLSGVALFFWPFVFFSQKKPLKFLAPLLAFAIVFLSGSRSGLFALVLQLFFIFLGKRLKVSTGKAIIASFLLLLLGFSLPFFEGGGWFENRAEIWETALLAGFDKPAFGNGFGSIEKALNNKSVELNNNIQYQYIDSAHNIFLDWWIQGGVVGLALLLFLIFYSARSFVQSDNKLKITLLLGVLIALSFNPASIVSLIHFWWIIGQGFGQER